MPRTKLMLGVFVTCLILSLPSQSAANPIVIVDTGTPPPNAIPWVFEALGQFFGGEFTIVDSFVIQSIEGYMRNDREAGTVDIAIHEDGGNVPGSIVFTAPMQFAAGAQLGWYGVYGLAEVLTPGTYWASFRPSGGISGAMMGLAPNPLSKYATATAFFGGYDWSDANTSDGLKLGVRITASVPDSTSTLSLLMGVVLLGFAAQRLWT